MPEYIVEMEHIYKSFAGIKALDDVSLHLEAGKVMALLGENGAGKSTLMKILSGVYTKDSGNVKVFGKKVDNPTPKQAQEMGIAIIHQELNMCTHLSVAENMFLGREIGKGGVINASQMRKKTKEALDRIKIDIDPDEVVGNLAVSKQQMVEIAKALSTNAKVLVMDEPTSALTSKEIDELFTIINNLKKEGCAIVYISHRLDELKHIADDVTIMRDGHFITRKKFDPNDMDNIIKDMVGREIKEKYPRVSCKKGKKILEVKNLNAGKLVRDVSFDVYEGEILGIAGLMGAGRTETTRAIFGVDHKDGGQIILDGKEIKINKPIDAIKQGISLVPEDRKTDGLCTKLSIKENIALPNLDILGGKTGVLNSKKEREMVKKGCADLTIKMSSADALAESLSGGNQQKIVVAKWLARNSRVVIFDEPTRGIDVGAKVEIYNLMNKLKQEGIGVLFVSSEMPEVLGVADRIIVMCDGRVTGELDIADATQEKVLKYATTFENKFEQ